MKPISKAQRAALEVLAAHGHGSAYELRRTLGVLGALVTRGYAERETHPGAFLSPRTCITFRINDAGRAALKDAAS